MTDKRIGAVVKADGDVAEIIVIPALLYNVASVTKSVGNEIERMKADVPILEGHFFHIVWLSISINNLTPEKLAFVHDAFGLTLPVI